MQELGYYVFFSKAAKIIKMNQFLKHANINSSNFSNYIKYKNLGAVDKTKLDHLYLLVYSALDELKKFA